jgi:hypothetical protein
VWNTIPVGPSERAVIDNLHAKLQISLGSGGYAD